MPWFKHILLPQVKRVAMVKWLERLGYGAGSHRKARV